MKRRICWFTLGGLIAFFALFAALLISIAYGWQRDWLRRESEARLAAALQQPVSIGALEGPLHREVTLRALRIGETSAPLLEIDVLRVRFERLRLAGAPLLVISKIELQRPELHLRRGLDGSWPWETPDEANANFAEGLPFEIAVGFLALDAGVVEFSDRLGGRTRFEIAGNLNDVRFGVDSAFDELQLSFAVRQSTEDADRAITGSLEASYAAGHFESVALRAEGRGFAAQVRGSATLEAIERATLSVRIDSLDAFDDLLLGDALALSGSLSITADLQGAFDWPTGSVAVNASNLRSRDLLVGDFRLEAVSEKAGMLRIDALELGGGPIEVTAEPGAVIVTDAETVALRGLALLGNSGNSSLEIELETSRAGSRGLDAFLHDVATRVDVRAKSWPLGALEPFWHSAGVEIAGVLGADLSLAGAVAGPQLRGSARLASGGIRTDDVEALGIRIDVDVDSVSAGPQGIAHWPTGTIVVDAADIHTEDLQLGALRLEATSEEPGTLRVDALRLRGSQLDVKADPGAVIVADAGRVALRGFTLRGNGGANSLEVELETSQAAFEGFDALLRDVATRIDVQAKSWRLGTLAPLWKFAGIEIGGVLDADLALIGAVAGPRLRGTAHLVSGDIRTSDVEVLGLLVDLDAEGAPESSRATLTASAQAIHWSNTPLGALNTAFEIVDRRDLAIEEFSLSGGLLAIRIAPGARLRAERDGVSFVNFDLTVEEQQFAVTGWVSTRNADRLRVEFSALDAARLIRIADELGEPVVAVEVAGEIGGHLAWDGPIGDPTLTGSLDWSRARFGELIFDQIAAGIDTQRGAVQIESRWTYEGRTALDAEVSLPASRILSDPRSLLDDPRLSLRLRADDFQLASVSRFLPRSTSGLAGSLTAELRATGGRFPSNVSGEFEISHGVATLRALGGQILSPIFARATLSDDLVEVDGFQIGEDASRVRGAGKLALSSGRVREIDFHLAFENFAIDAPGLVKGTLDGPIDLTGTAGAPVVQGNLELSGLKVQIPEPNAIELKEIRVYSADEEDTDVVLREGETGPTLFDLLDLDVSVAVRRNSWARGRGAEIELRGNLEAKKEPRLPLALSGSFETVRGTYEIYGRRFQIDRGQVVLDGAAEVDPVLDVRAEHRVRDVRIFAMLTGRLSEPTLRFESEPELSETDIASYLFLGRPADAVAGGQQPALDAAAAQIAAGAALREFERLFGGALPVDMLDVRMEGNGENSELRAGVGKYVGERLFLHYERGFGDEAGDELRVEYELTPRWSVESTLSSDDEIGADLIFEAEN